MCRLKVWLTPLVPLLHPAPHPRPPPPPLSWPFMTSALPHPFCLSLNRLLTFLQPSPLCPLLHAWTSPPLLLHARPFFLFFFYHLSASIIFQSTSHLPLSSSSSPSTFDPLRSSRAEVWSKDLSPRPSILFSFLSFCVVFRDDLFPSPSPFHDFFFFFYLIQ